MQISERDIQNTISGIVRFFKFEALTADIHYHVVLQDRYISQLQGINLLIGHTSRNLALIDSAKAEIKNTLFQSGDLCRSSVQSPDVLGQGSNQ